MRIFGYYERVRAKNRGITVQITWERAIIRKCDSQVAPRNCEWALAPRKEQFFFIAHVREQCKITRGFRNTCNTFRKICLSPIFEIIPQFSRSRSTTSRVLSSKEKREESFVRDPRTRITRNEIVKSCSLAEKEKERENKKTSSSMWISRDTTSSLCFPSLTFFPIPFSTYFLVMTSLPACILSIRVFKRAALISSHVSQDLARDRQLSNYRHLASWSIKIRHLRFMAHMSLVMCVYN